MARSQERLKERQERLSPTLQQERTCFDQTKKSASMIPTWHVWWDGKKHVAFFLKKKKRKRGKKPFSSWGWSNYANLNEIHESQLPINPKIGGEIK